jgi:transposase InsO family protein
LSSLCTLLGYTRQAFYGYKQHCIQEVFEVEIIIQEVLKHRILQPRIGARKLMVIMEDFIREHQISLGRDGLFDLLREHQLLIRKRRKRAQTTFSKHWYKKYKNLIHSFEPLAPNLLWVSDITYIVIEQGFAYLSLITDAYSRKVVGFYLSQTLEATGCIRALQMALKGCANTTNLIHHSDRGVQYCSHEYVKLLEGRRIQISMTENGDPLENAIAERVNGILKDELLQQQYSSFEQAQKSVAAAISVYNTLRPHSSCDMLTPQVAHTKEGVLKKHWKNYYKQKEVVVAAP